MVVVYIFDSDGQIDTRRQYHYPLQHIKTWMYGEIEQIDQQQHQFDKCRIVQGKYEEGDGWLFAFPMQ